MPSKSEPALCIDSSQNTLNMGRTEMQDVKIKEEAIDCQDEKEGIDEDDEDNDKYSEESSYPMDLPLEVITTIEPFNYAYPYLKNMSNGVLTHRNIFTEQERDVLKKIVDKYREIVDTRSRTREIYMEKQSVWQQIVEEYNSTENILVRTEKELKKCWDNMKYRARQAEKEQMKQDLNRSSPDPHQMAYDAVQAALEKMLTMQSQNESADGNIMNGIADRDNMLDLHNEAKENWNSISSLQENDSKFSINGDFENDEMKNDEDPYDDDQPVLKKARQESPKLSSILLGDAKKMPYSKSSDVSSNPRNHYTIPNCTKVTHMKKKSKKLNSSSPVTILPKGLNSCVSIMNIPNPNQSMNSLSGTNSSSSTLDITSNGMGEGLHPSGSINLGGGITISPQKLNSLPSSAENSNSSQIKPMPFLKKMFPNKTSRKGLRTSLNNRMPYSPYDSIQSLVNDSLSEMDADRGLLEEKLLLQRLEFGSQEHSLRMKVLEKQLQAYTNESQFWALKMKMLKNRHEEPFEKVNGELF